MMGTKFWKMAVDLHDDGYESGDDGSRMGADGYYLVTTGLRRASSSFDCMTTGIMQACTGCRSGDDGAKDARSRVNSRVYKG